MTILVLVPPATDSPLLAQEAPYVYGGPPPPIRQDTAEVQKPALSPPFQRLVQTPKAETPPATTSSLSSVDLAKQQAVKDAFLYAWNAYESHCFGQDEYFPPRQQQSCGNWMGAGLTLIDAIDTMHVMGLTEKFEKAKKWIADSLRFDYPNFVSVFETTIRIVGGLNTAYDFTGDRMFLTKSQELADKLLRAFETGTGIPRSEVSLKSGSSRTAGWLNGAVVLSEVGTIQVEFAFLSHHLNIPRYNEKAERVIELLSRASHSNGLYPIFLNPDTAQFTNAKVTLGAMGDSFYEYLLKMWILTGSKRNTLYERMYKETSSAIVNLMITRHNDDTFIADYENGYKDLKMDHLACFVPGMFALGAKSGIVDDTTAAQHMQIAKEMMKTCFMMYARQPSGIGPEYVRWSPDMSVGEASFHLRPETVESLFVLWRTTHDPIYREWGWRIFQAIEKHCRVDLPAGGYVGLRDVRQPSLKQDKMESFFLAETLKYLYLLFSPDELIPLAGANGYQSPGYVFNTECHPVKAWGGG